MPLFCLKCLLSIEEYNPSHQISNKPHTHYKLTMFLDARVCVVGGGISGLSTIHRLLDDEHTPFAPEDVLLLEAQDYLGGRIRTNRTSSKIGKSYDLGASWFHDSLTNTVLKQCVNDGTFNIRDDGRFTDKNAKVYHYDKEKPIDLNGLRGYSVISELEKYIEHYYFENIGIEDMSLQEIVSKYVDEFEDSLTEEQIKYVIPYIRHMESWMGLHWSDISAKYSSIDFEGRDIFNLKGFDFLVTKLLKDVPENRLFMNQQVKCINLGEKHNGRRVAVECASGLKVTCDYLVVTIPQSVLSLPSSHDYGIEWIPRLPLAVESAIQSVHFGQLGKCIFEFNNIWWDAEEDLFEILACTNGPDTKRKSPLEQHHDDRIPEVFTLHTTVYNLSLNNFTECNKGGALLILTLDPVTQFVESSPHLAWRYYKPALSKLCIPEASITDPINVITSNWSQNPYIRGSYTALRVQDDPNEIYLQLKREVRSSMPSYIRFAGEHTVLDGNGCIHGAFSSGQEEASWILQDCK